MNADCAFAIGGAHAVCQDYARAAQTEHRVSAWLADGCSSSPDTDFGARLLVQVAIGHEAELLGGEWCPFADAVAGQATRAAQTLGLAPQSLDATLVGIVADRETGQFRALLYGDGALVLGRRDGSREIHHVEYARNYPLYLSYRGDPARASCWASEAANERVTTVVRADGEVETTSRRTDEPTLLGGSIEEFQYAMVFSDGVTSFARHDPDGQTAPTAHHWRDVLTDLTAIKGWRGEFVRRRMGRFLRDAGVQGLRHSDDLSMAAVYFGE